MLHAINPQVMQETLQGVTGSTYTTFNFGIPSGTTPIFLMVTHEAATHKPPPKVFILGVTPALFSCCDAIGAAGTQPGVALVGGAALREGRLAHERRGRGRERLLRRFAPPRDAHRGLGADRP